MDNVSSIKFDYRMVRKPKMKSINIFTYAANMKIVFKNKVFLIIEDLCIIDFIYKLSLYDFNFNIYEFIPIDSEDRVLIFKRIDCENIEITSEWTNNRIVINKKELIDSIKLLKLNFEKNSRVKVNEYYE